MCLQSQKLDVSGKICFCGTGQYMQLSKTHGTLLYLGDELEG